MVSFVQLTMLSLFVYQLRLLSLPLVRPRVPKRPCLRIYVRQVHRSVSVVLTSVLSLLAIPKDAVCLTIRPDCRGIVSQVHYRPEPQISSLKFGCPRLMVNGVLLRRVGPQLVLSDLNLRRPVLDDVQLLPLGGLDLMQF